MFLCFKEPYEILTQSTLTAFGLADISIKLNFILAVNTCPKVLSRSSPQPALHLSIASFPPYFLLWAAAGWLVFFL